MGIGHMSVWLKSLSQKGVSQAKACGYRPVKQWSPVAAGFSLRTFGTDSYGALLLRAGRPGEALQKMSAARKANKNENNPFWMPFLILTHHHLGNVEEEKNCKDQFYTQYEANQSWLLTIDKHSPRWWWETVVRMEVLKHEVDSLAKKTAQSPKAPGATERRR